MNWRNLEEPWRLALSQAWEARLAGSIGVGAVLTDPIGTITAFGRNRVSDPDAPPGHMHDTFLAHAEIDVLGQLPRGTYDGYTIWSTLEPCAFCSTAIVMSKVNQVRYAARDPLWEDIDRMSSVDPFIADHWPERKGPMPGPTGAAMEAFCQTLAILWFLERHPEGRVARTYTAALPQVIEFALSFVNSDRFKAETSVETVLAAVWDDLTRITASAP